LSGNPTSAARLARVRVQNLFGNIDLDIPFNLDARITAIIAPNGMGKTVCLRLINALFRHQWSVFSSTDFAEIEFTFSDESRVVCRHLDRDESSDDGEPSVEFFSWTSKGQDRWAPKNSNQTVPNIVRVEHYLPFLTRVGPSRWVHDHTRQSFTLQELLDLYGEQLPESVVASINPKPSDILAELTDGIDCHLIETQRLLILPDDRRSPTSTLAISRKAQTLKTIVSRELASYATLSQSLDRSFPRRVIQEGAVLPPEDLKASLAQLDELRRQLMEAGILDTENDDAFSPPDAVDAAVAAVLSVYVSDTRRKLRSLSNILEKITLFKELIDERFRPKYISVDKDKGFTVTRGDDLVIPLDKLSSGEQHQLVLFFELLFELKENALILIDEPELSLHVGWQKKFIPDLKRIIELNHFDVLLATHSPQLIGHWDELVVEFGDIGE